MKIIDIDLLQLIPAPWNPNYMETEELTCLKRSVQSYGLVQNLVVRPLKDNKYEVLSGNQRLAILKELNFSPVSCVVLDMDDAHARLLAQALNHIHGGDDLGLRAELLKKVLETISADEVIQVLPETKGRLDDLVSLGQSDIANYLQSWEKAQGARLKHMQFQLVPNQRDIVERALFQALPIAKQEKGDNPNVRGTALYLICKFYLEEKHE